MLHPPPVLRDPNPILWFHPAVGLLLLSADCAAFPSRTEEYEEEIGLVRDVQCQTEAILFPASELNSSLLKLAGQLLKSEELESLADQDTPSSTHFNVKNFTHFYTFEFFIL